MPNNQDRIFGYDLIKTVAIFMIVFYHLGGLDYGEIVSGKCYWPNFNKFILSFCAASVPLFLLVHGALILPKHFTFWESLLKASQMAFLFFFGKLVLQYIILERCFFIEEKMVHFWFLGTLAIVYILSFFVNLSKKLQVISLVFLLIYPFFTNLLFDILVIFKLDTHFPLLRHDGFFTLYALVYFYFGYYLKDKQIPTPNKLLLVFIGLFLINFEVFVLSNHFHLLYDGVNSSFPTIGALFLSLGFYFLFKDTTTIYDVIRKLISFIGSNTLGIYILHVMAIFLLRKYVQFDILNYNLLTSILWTLIIIFITTLFYNYIKTLFVSLNKMRKQRIS